MSRSNLFIQETRPDGTPIVGAIFYAAYVNGQLVRSDPKEGPLPGITSNPNARMALPTFRNGIDWAHDEDGWTTVRNGGRRVRRYKFHEDD